MWKLTHVLRHLIIVQDIIVGTYNLRLYGAAKNGMIAGAKEEEYDKNCRDWEQKLQKNETKWQ